MCIGPHALGCGGAQPIWNVTADLTTLGKVIGGGFPVGAIGGRREVMVDPSKGKPALPYGGMFSANPISMLVGVAAIKLLDDDTFAHLDDIGDKVRSGINAALAQYHVPGKAIGKGSLVKVHFTPRDVVDYRTAFALPVEASALDPFNRGMLNCGVLSASYGLMALSTPMTEADVQEIAGAAAGGCTGIP